MHVRAFVRLLAAAWSFGSQNAKLLIQIDFLAVCRLQVVLFAIEIKDSSDAEGSRKRGKMRVVLNPAKYVIPREESECTPFVYMIADNQGQADRVSRLRATVNSEDAGAPETPSGSMAFSTLAPDLNVHDRCVCVCVHGSDATETYPKRNSIAGLWPLWF